MSLDDLQAQLRGALDQQFATLKEHYEQSVAEARRQGTADGERLGAARLDEARRQWQTELDQAIAAARTEAHQQALATARHERNLLEQQLQQQLEQTIQHAVNSVKRSSELQLEALRRQLEEDVRSERERGQAAVEEERQRADQAVADAQHAFERLSQTLAEERARAAAELGAVKQLLEAEIASAHGQAEQARAELATGREEAEGARARIETAEQDAATARAEAAAARARLEAAEQDARAARAEAAAARTKIEAAEHETATARADAAAARTNLEAAEQQAAAVRAEAAAAAQELAVARAAALTASQQASGAQATVAAATQEAASAKEEAATAARELAAAKAELAAAAQDAATARAEAAAARDAAATAAQAAEAAHAAASTGGPAVTRLADAIRAVDAAGSLSQTLAALLEHAAAMAGRAALFLINGDRLKAWKSVDIPEIDAQTVESSIGGRDLLARAIQTGQATAASASLPAPPFARLAHGAAVAVPLLIAGRAVAVLYADAPGEQDTTGWADTVDVLVRYASSAAALRAATRTLDVVRGNPSDGEGTTGNGEERARRYARLLVSEIKLYNEAAVRAGRQQRDLRQRLGAEIDRALRLYEERVPPAVGARDQFFQQELVQTLADGDPSLLGS